MPSFNRVRCPGCKRSLSYTPQLIGQQVQCKKCNTQFALLPNRQEFARSSPTKVWPYLTALVSSLAAYGVIHVFFVPHIHGDPLAVQMEAGIVVLLFGTYILHEIEGFSNRFQSEEGSESFGSSTLKKFGVLLMVCAISYALLKIADVKVTSEEKSDEHHAGLRSATCDCENRPFASETKRMGATTKPEKSANESRPT